MNELVKTVKTTQEIESMTEDQALNLWRKTNIQKFPSQNKIVLQNQKFVDDKANPDFGKIFAYSYNDGEETIKEIKTFDTFYPIMTRVQIVSKYSEGKQKYRIKEVNQGWPIEVMDTATNEIVFKGSYQDAKEEYGLSYKQAVYVYYEDSIYRWVLGGGETRTSWFEIQNAVRQLNAPYEVNIKEIIPMKNTTTYWNEIKFELGKPFDIKFALNLQMQVSKLLGDVQEDQEEMAKEIFKDDLPFD